VGRFRGFRGVIHTGVKYISLENGIIFVCDGTLNANFETVGFSATPGLSWGHSPALTPEHPFLSSSDWDLEVTVLTFTPHNSSSLPSDPMIFHV